MIPQFVLFSKMSLLTTPWPLILPKLTGNVLMIFCLTQFLDNIPDSVIEAAKIDGGNYFQIYQKIILPLVKPALAAHGVLWFIGAWNDYLVPVLIIYGIFQRWIVESVVFSSVKE